MSDFGGGSGSRLPPNVLLLASLSAGFSTILSIWCIIRQLKNYRKPLLQRFVVRILIMVPIYALSSLVSLYSLDAAFFIDAVRDVYEAFVIYCFFNLLVEYLGGERSLIILLHGRNPTPHPWPVSRFLAPIDISDPYTFLALKRGILQYVQVKPVLAVLTMIFKATGTYNDGALKGDSGYTYVSVAYNVSVSLSLYCLAMFWVCTNADLKPYRPVPKFLCVKGIIFFSFWQGFVISVLVAAHLLKSASYDRETLSLAVQDTLICFEMPLFAILHLYAFSHKDYEDPELQYSGRMPFYYAFRDSIFGFKDVLEDSLTTLKGTGFSYRTFEPAEGALHQGPGRERRVRAGLRYAAGGKAKYWLPMPGDTDGEAYGRKEKNTPWRKPWSEAKKAMAGHRHEELGYAPITPEQARDVVHRDPREVEDGEIEGVSGFQGGFRTGRWDVTPGIGHRSELQGVGGQEYDSDEESDGSQVEFDDPMDAKDDEDLYRDARQLEFGDWNNPVLDASKEDARRIMREQEDGFLSGRRPYQRSRKPTKGKGKGKERASPGSEEQPPSRPKRSLLHSTSPPKSPTRAPRSSTPKSAEAKGKKAVKELPEGCVDLLVEDVTAEEDKAAQERIKGEANLRGDGPRKVFRRVHPELGEGEPIPPQKEVDDERIPAPGSESGEVVEEVVVNDPQAERAPIGQGMARDVEPPRYAVMKGLVESDSEVDSNPWG